MAKVRGVLAVFLTVLSHLACVEGNENVIDSAPMPSFDTTQESNDKAEMSGNPCSRYTEEGDAPSNVRDITFHAGKRVTVFYRTPKRWSPGKYICVWNIKMISENKYDRHGVNVLFRRLFLPPLEDEGRCRDKISISHLETKYTYTSDRLCGKKNQLKYQTDWKTLQVKLEVVVLEDEQQDEQRTSFAVVFTANTRYESDTPTFFKVKDIISATPNQSPVKGFDFTWMEAREFCWQHAPGHDLCEFHIACPNYRVPFPRKLGRNRKTLQFFPSLRSYNSWVDVTFPHCDLKYIDSGPYMWGLNKTLCPENGCESKSHLYCCFHNEPQEIPSIMTEIKVATLVVAPGKYAYRYADPSDSVSYDYHDEDELYWDQDWKKVGRIEGDLVHFQLNAFYTPDYQVPVYFCTRYDSYRDEDTHRFMASLQPCESPWKSDFHAFGSSIPREGLTAIHFGYNSQELGSRVSTTPPCCGYDKDTFIIYGVIDGEAAAKVPSLRCSKDTEFTGPSGTIFSPGYPGDVPQHVDCKWRIRVKEGHGIRLKGNESGGGEGCWDKYLWFTDSVSGLFYGRSCANEISEEFLTYSNILEISLLSGENDIGRFLINYTEVDNQATPPSKFILPNEDATWSAAEDLCKSKKMQLCRKQDICPFSSAVAAQSEAPRWAAIRDQQNDWIQTGNLKGDLSLFTGVCETYIAKLGPPTWGEEKIDKKNCESTTPNDVYWETDPCVVQREEVFCCELSGLDSARGGHLFPLFDVPDPVRVNVGYHQNSYGPAAYWFGKADEWKTPYYFDIDYYHISYLDDYMANLTESDGHYPWRPPGSDASAPDNVVDYFILSSKFVKDHFEQIVYFCRSLYVDYDKRYRKEYRVQLEPCTDYGIELAFYLYAGKQQSAFANVPVHFGKSPKTGKVCCADNKAEFTVYALDAGKEKSYEGLNMAPDYGYFETY